MVRMILRWFTVLGLSALITVPLVAPMGSLGAPAGAPARTPPPQSRQSEEEHNHSEVNQAGGLYCSARRPDRLHRRVSQRDHLSAPTRHLSSVRSGAWEQSVSALSDSACYQIRTTLLFTPNPPPFHDLSC